MEQKHLRRSEQEWQTLIRECRGSGLTVKEWCEQHHITRNSFYHHNRKSRYSSCESTEHRLPLQPERQEVVALTFPTVDSENAFREVLQDGRNVDPAIRLVFPGFSVEIQNSAAKKTIGDTIAALRKLC